MDNLSDIWLERDLQQESDGCHSYLRGVPKPLLPVGDRPLISHWIAALTGMQPPPAGVTVVVNTLHFHRFEEWLESLPPSSLHVDLLSDFSHDNETRTGAVACMWRAVSTDMSQHWLVIAGDTLLPPSFDASALLAELRHRQESCSGPVSIVVSAPVSDENVSKYGILEASPSGRVLRMLEKPHPSATASRLQSPCVYLLNRGVLHQLQEFLEFRAMLPLSARDATGHFISQLVLRSPVYHYPVEERYDIGDLSAYLQCCSRLALQF